MTDKEKLKKLKKMIAACEDDTIEDAFTLADLDWFDNVKDDVPEWAEKTLKDWWKDLTSED